LQTTFWQTQCGGSQTVQSSWDLSESWSPYVCGWAYESKHNATI